MQRKTNAQKMGKKAFTGFFCTDTSQVSRSIWYKPICSKWKEEEQEALEVSDFNNVGYLVST